MHHAEASRPWILDFNRVERFFIGGCGLDKWQNLTGGQSFGDATYSEELLVNTTPYIGPGTPPLNGLSIVEQSGEKTLRSMIDNDPAGFLGEELSKAFANECPVLCKAGDSTGRLILQYHPTRDFARQYLHHPFGKTEAWYMLATRNQADNFCYAGFKSGVTRKQFERLVETDDVDGMLDCIHKVPFKTGDVILIPAGTIHAMGPNTTFLEIHEPCDYTMRFERYNYGRRMNDDDFHYGLGFRALFDGLDFTTYTAMEIEQKVRFSPIPQASESGWELLTLLPAQRCAEFSIDLLRLSGSYILPETGKYKILVALRGNVNFSELTLPQGRAAFIPAGAGALEISGSDGEVLLVNP